MNHLEKRQWIRLACCALVVLAAVLWLCGVFSGGNVRYHLRNRGSLGPLTRENIAYLDTAAPAATGKDGMVSASDWAETYPRIVATMGDNSKNSYGIIFL